MARHRRTSLFGVYKTARRSKMTRRQATSVARNTRKSRKSKTPLKWSF